MAAKKASGKKKDLQALSKEWGDKMTSYLKEATDQIGLATKKDLESLEKRIDKLEAKKKPAKKAAKKKPAKKKPAKKKPAKKAAKKKPAKKK
jgi:BMFP domain-containing protein YqiC